MSKHVDYYLSLVSPYTYMGHERFEALAQKNGIEVAYKPTNYGKVFPVSGGLPLNKRPPQRLAYRMMELRRWSAHLGIAMNLEPRHFPVPDALPARVVVSAVEQGAHPGKLIGAYLRAVWAEERDVTDEATVRAIAAEQGYDADALMEAAARPETEAAYDAISQEAIDRGVFGAPTWIVDGELFWGQDRLDFLEHALAG